MLHITDVLTYFKQNGFRITKTRTSILKLFYESNKPLSPSSILSLLHQAQISVNKTTVYREIDFLLSQKIIMRVKIDSTSDLYEPTHRPHHHHAICTDCGAIEDLIFKREHSFIKEAQTQTSITIKDHALEFYGLCQNCI